MLLGFAGLIFLGVLGGSGVPIEAAPFVGVLYAIFLLPMLPILLILVIVIVGVYFGLMKRREIGDQPPREDATPAPADEPKDAEE